MSATAYRDHPSKEIVKDWSQKERQGQGERIREGDSRKLINSWNSSPLVTVTVIYTVFRSLK